MVDHIEIWARYRICIFGFSVKIFTECTDNVIMKIKFQCLTGKILSSGWISKCLENLRHGQRICL